MRVEASPCPELTEGVFLDMGLGNRNHSKGGLNCGLNCSDMETPKLTFLEIPPCCMPGFAHLASLAPLPLCPLTWPKTGLERLQRGCVGLAENTQLLLGC